jgi:hypothetical protein
MLNPTFRIGYPSIEIRQTDEQIDVTDPKWNCVNFNIEVQVPKRLYSYSGIHYHSLSLIDRHDIQNLSSQEMVLALAPHMSSI